MTSHPTGSAAAVLALGSNLPPRNYWLDLGLAFFEENGVALLGSTPRWHTTAVGDLPQPDFLNQLVLVRGNRQGRDWLEVAQAAERRAGRTREVRGGPRTLDVDVVLIEGQKWATPELTVPHHALLERPYLLRGVALLVPGWVLPGDGGAVAEVADARLRGSWAGWRQAARELG